MTLFTVYARRAPPQADPLEIVFVKEGFCWPALFFPIPWLIFRKMGWALILYLLVLVGAALLEKYLPSGGAVPGIFLLFSLLFALEANQLRADALLHSGYRMVGLAEGADLVEAELRFFSSFPPPSLPTSSPFPGPQPGSLQGAPRPLADNAQPVIGLFPLPRGQA